ncbi:MAG TPA: helix-turn-helix domain-containing protein [Saprospiraceae bacterium]|nr:helix-turn-helix domain-containing protein [Saprospiraceae bacterium]
MQVELYFCVVKKIRKRSDCPISSALDIVGDKWSLLVIRDIAFAGKNTYNEFLKSDEMIATNVLADRLAMLEAAGILAKEEHPASRAKIFYRLSKQGVDLLPVLAEMILWSDKYLLISPKARQLAKQLRKDKDTTIKQISAALKRG